MVGLASVTFGGAANVRIGQLRHYISTRLSPDQAYHHITTHGSTTQGLAADNDSNY
jgi:hypothetical protein